MGTVISISVYTDLDKTVAEYIAIVTRLMERGEIHSIETSGFVSSAGSSHFFTEDIRSRVADDGLEAVANQFLYSDQPLTVRLLYNLYSNRVIPFDVCLYGHKYERGFRVEVDGFIKISIALNDLIRPLKNVDQSDWVAANQTFSALMQDEEELLFRILGIDSQKSKHSNFPHAAMYLEMGWPSAVGCSFLYHNDIAEFTRDFARIFLDFNQRINIRSSLVRDIDIWRIKASEPPSKGQTAFYRQFVEHGKDKNALLNFLHELDEQKARRLADLDKSTIREAFLWAGEEVDNIVCYDLGETGLALASPPEASIWRAFQFVAENF